jgi:pantetheine-phosphate adenylyltransferase
MKAAFFAGTFDPPTLGHQELIHRAAALSDKLYVAVARSEGKHALLLPQNERIKLLQRLTKSLENVEVIPLVGLVVDCAQEYGAGVLVRGLRSSADFDFEMQMGAANRQMTGIETLCLFSSPEYSQINSTLVREIASNGRRLKGFVPDDIEQEVFDLLSKSK